MKSRRKGWPLVVETLITIAVLTVLFIWFLFNTSFGDGMPDQFKIWAPTVLGVVCLGFLYTHRTPDGGVEYKIW